MKKKGFENCFTLNNISDIIWKIVSLVILLLFITGIAFGMESPQLHADKSDPVDVEQTVQYQIYLPLVLKGGVETPSLITFLDKIRPTDKWKWEKY